MLETQLRNWVCEIGRRLHVRGMVASTGGNISVRLGDGLFLCTPGGVSKGFMHPGDLVVADGKGNKVRGEGRVTSEFMTHLAAYEERPDRNAVVHAHPICATALTLAGIDTRIPLLPELVMSLVALPAAPYATPGSIEGAGVIRGLIRDFDAILLDRHGALTVGKDLNDAYMKMEHTEHAAQTLYRAYGLGTPCTLPKEAVMKLMAATVAPGENVPPYPFEY
jgi:L-fuculose-phosphate aldolase